MKLNYAVNRVRRKIMRLLTHNVGRNKGNIDLANATNIKRILISRPNSRLGNQLMVTPLLQEVCRIFPHSQVDLFVRSRIAPIIFQNYSNVNSFITLPGKPFKQLFKYLGVWLLLIRRRYDLIINTECSSSSGRLSTAFCRARYKLFCDIDEKLSLQYSDYRHMAKHPVYSLRKYLGQQDFSNPPIPTLDIRLTDDEMAKGKEILDNMVGNGKRTIGIYTFGTGSKRFSSDWWNDAYRKLCEEFRDEYNIMEVLPIENVSQIDFKAPSYYSRDIREMTGVMANLAAFVTADCGIMHLASATTTPILGLFSITNPAIYCPYNAGSAVLSGDSLFNSDEMVATLKNMLAKKRD